MASGVEGNNTAGSSVNDFISKARGQQRKGLKPSGPELIAYARYLGIDPVVDHDLLWIAVDALEAPLPHDRTEHFDSDDRVFYYNTTTRVSSWTHPLEHIYREVYETIVNIRKSTRSVAEQQKLLHQMQLEVEQLEHDVQQEVQQWTEHTDDSGKRFFFNAAEKKSTWADPRPAKCHVLYLKKKMLRTLIGSCGSGDLGPTKRSKDAAGIDASLWSLPGDGGSGSRPVSVGLSSDAAAGYDAGGAGCVSAPAKNSSGAVALEPLASAAAGDEAEGSGSCSYGTDGTDAADDHGKKKKKKKKHEKVTLGELHGVDLRDVGPPPRPSRHLGHSQSEPSIGSKTSLPTASEEARPALGMQPGVPQLSSPVGLGEKCSDAAAPLSTLGRVHVKNGIRLKPLTSTDLATLANRSGRDVPMPALQNSNSVPTLLRPLDLKIPEPKDRPLERLVLAGEAKSADLT
eukprot:gnl/TRDRNA2_/TRDRNA2_69241_c1_seq1.p1 gnl/TRDRNA2_/TRDRNA2_69241_c1~~gnl/TRDRNA2_/TRDRNA2_69241_c1_seq1.p1  ORF type:complete len:475 (+),score=73.30 gnl/TRDRNA2_/TRDRNA2_69241_c1_seq1:54-1427(+)